MGLVTRQPGERRWGMPVEFPLRDSSGMFVVHDRRSASDRRKSPAALEDLLVLFSGLLAADPGEKQ